MGAWETGVFDNDGAGDFLIIVERDYSAIVNQIEYVETTWSEEEYMEVDEGSCILAAGELILEAYGVHPVQRLTEKIDLAAVKSQITLELLQKVIGLIRIALNMDNSDRSEVYELWAEADPEDFAKWKQTGQAILHQLEQLSVGA